MLQLRKRESATTSFVGKGNAHPTPPLVAPHLMRGLAFLLSDTHQLLPEGDAEG
jgi:hypothetical protein